MDAFTRTFLCGAMVKYFYIKQTAPKVARIKSRCFGGSFTLTGNGRGAVVRKAENIIGTGMVETGKLDQHLGGDIPLAGLVIGVADLCAFQIRRNILFAADHDPPADPGYVDTWYLPQRL